MNYEISKTRKYKKDIGKMENMEYDPEKDSYRCQNRKMLTVQYQRKQKTATGYLRTVTVYQCHFLQVFPKYPLLHLRIFLYHFH